MTGYQDGIFAVDRLFWVGFDGKDISDDEIGDDVLLLAYNAGRRRAGRDPMLIMETKLSDGARSRLESEHPANFRADA